MLVNSVWQWSNSGHNFEISKNEFSSGRTLANNIDQNQNTVTMDLKKKAISRSNSYHKSHTNTYSIDVRINICN